MGKSIFVLIWVIVVTILSLMPVEPQKMSLFPHADKVTHFIFYFGMASLIAWSNDHQNLRILAKAFFISALYGILMEVLQDNIGTGRNFDIFDILANINGALIGVILYYFFRLRNGL